MRPNAFAAAIAAASISLACGTYLEVSQMSPAPDCAAGVIVNRRAVYGVAFKASDGSPIALQSTDKAKISGIDTENVVVIGVTRMPFSSGKLGVGLGPHQVPKKVEITSQTGIVRAAEVEKDRLERRKAIEKAEDEAGK